MVYKPVLPGPSPRNKDAAGIRAQRAATRWALASLARLGSAGSALPLRAILMGLSACGMLAAAMLLADGHGWLGVRLLAGDVLLIFGLLLLASR